MTDAEFMLSYVNRKQQRLLGRTVHDGNREQVTEEYATANALEALAKIQRIVDIYFQPWGAAKAAMWEEVSGDGLFNAETALRIIQKQQDEALRAFREKMEGK